MTTKILVLVLLLASFLRFYNLPDMVPFEYDDQYNSYLVYNLVHNHKLSLVGQETSFGGMFLGPWHYLYLTPFYIATGLHPVGGFIGEGVIGLLTVVSYFYIGSRLFSPATGLLAAFIRSVSMILIAQDLNIGPAYPSELVAVWFFYFLWRLMEGNQRSLIFLSFLGGMMFTVHLSVLPLLLVLAVVLVAYRPIKLDLNLLVKSVLAFFVPISPILFFEIRHHFSHISRFFTALSDGGSGSHNYVARLGSELYQVSAMLYSIFDPTFLPSWMGFILLVAIGGMLYIKKTGKLFLLTFGIVLLYYLVYPRNVPNYYFMALIPLTVLYVATLLVWIWSFRPLRFLAFGIVALTVISNLTVYYDHLTHPNKFNLAQKDAAVKAIVDHQKDKGPFSVSYFMPYGREYGFQYFFTYYGVEPRPEVKPPVYSIVMPRNQVAREDLSLEFGDIGVIFPEKENQY